MPSVTRNVLPGPMFLLWGSREKSRAPARSSNFRGPIRCIGPPRHAARSGQIGPPARDRAHSSLRRCDGPVPSWRDPKQDVWCLGRLGAWPRNFARAEFRGFFLFSDEKLDWEVGQLSDREYQGQGGSHFACGCYGSPAEPQMGQWRSCCEDPT
jgi:hypothetical protein